MTSHQHGHRPDAEQMLHHEVGLADLLDIEAHVLGSHLDEVMAWVGAHAPDAPRTVVDLGAGTGAGTLALARRFPTAEVIAIDRSALMLERVRAAAATGGLAHQLRIEEVDLDAGWPAIPAVDVAWASSSLHEVGDPDRLLRGLYDACNANGLVVIVEMDGLPRFLPDDVGLGRPGLERRCHAVLERMHWNAHPDWRPYLERAGFQFVGQRTFTVPGGTAPAATAATARYAQAYLSRFRSALAGQVAADDFDTLDRLLADDNPHAVLRRQDLPLVASRTAWAARRP